MNIGPRSLARLTALVVALIGFSAFTPGPILSSGRTIVRHDIQRMAPCFGAVAMHDRAPGPAI